MPPQVFWPSGAKNPAGATTDGQCPSSTIARIEWLKSASRSGLCMNAMVSGVLAWYSIFDNYPVKSRGISSHT